jgi:hypothetical protein
MQEKVPLPIAVVKRWVDLTAFCHSITKIMGSNLAWVVNVRRFLCFCCPFKESCQVIWYLCNIKISCELEEINVLNPLMTKRDNGI